MEKIANVPSIYLHNVASERRSGSSKNKKKTDSDSDPVAEDSQILSV